MNRAFYDIVPNAHGWGVRHDGETTGEYVTKEAAFEAAIPAASLAIRHGHEVLIRVSEQRSGDTSDGTPTEPEHPELTRIWNMKRVRR
ncbi:MULTISPECIES: hypothetical protein [unclassified Beijerinckia]|uniref:hypothetical protein n=1 Tax=unclassified Beijerinckia TaxID=2638183 RepID=UPI000894E79B|nr:MULTISPECIES: hypothetical protein [unclassified Beijerinckia]MDH7794473.1 hypothetical protein [Beijerinckia sp. GAS462]SEB63504.1 hypothetical protein SAMN05443249_0745 [Beijerinckia sp. 28-YEA-48]